MEDLGEMEMVRKREWVRTEVDLGRRGDVLMGLRCLNDWGKWSLFSGSVLFFFARFFFILYGILNGRGGEWMDRSSSPDDNDDDNGKGAT